MPKSLNSISEIEKRNSANSLQTTLSSLSLIFGETNLQFQLQKRKRTLINK